MNLRQSFTERRDLEQSDFVSQLLIADFRQIRAFQNLRGEHLRKAHMRANLHHVEQVQRVACRRRRRLVTIYVC